MIPLGPQPSADLAVAIHSPAAIIRLLRRPRLATVIELLAAGDLDIEGGTLLDLAARRGATSRGLARRIDKWLVARTLLPFLLESSSGGSQDSHAYDRPQVALAASQRDDKALV
jgi:cyclopropane-fatty-acyl-phospholipid synthase